jgi:hypothetical protein
MGVSKVAFPRRLQLQNYDSTGANLSKAIKCRCMVKLAYQHQRGVAPMQIGERPSASYDRFAHAGRMSSTVVGGKHNTLRQRVSRLVRDALSFSKKLAHHIGAIKLFICHYNLTRAAV